LEFLIASASGTLYTGITNNIERRVWEYKTSQFEGFARRYPCNRLVRCEGFDDVRKAIDREKKLKGWRRSKKIALIELRYPRWADLAEKRGRRMAVAGESIRER
jgi:putative endonuclease